MGLQPPGFKRAVPGETNRTPYKYGDVIDLYLNGFLNRIRHREKTDWILMAEELES